MATFKKIRHILYPDLTMTLALYTGLESCKELRKSVMEGTVVASLLKASMIVDPFQVIVAANKAVHLHQTNNMTTKNVHSEILYCLSPSKNISESFRSFGAADDDNSVFVVIVDDTEDKTLQRISDILGHSPTDVDAVASLFDTELIKKAYKLTEEELSVYPVLDALVSRIAAKEIITTGKGKS
ncbi:hypothetical protein RRG08_033480 [Elysia crispata]|uniref:TP53RK-binding protein n=1 Tax=Elysia crispata TaxID=231223 RepID=A0AAE1E4A9_9GAST|nr:hypothetical protein RRG08_033480 [Elysia crispata]